MSRAVPDTFEGVPIRIATAEDLILSKLVASRAIDWSDAVSLLREQVGRIDLEYLQGWAGRLGLEQELAAALTEAGEAQKS
jgi:hypothetical protein